MKSIGKFIGKTAAVFRGGVSSARESYRISRERQIYNAKLELEELKNEARQGNIIAQRYLAKRGIFWGTKVPAPPVIDV